MIEISEVLAALGTEEGKVLLATYINLFLKSNYPEQVNDETAMESAMTAIVEGLSQCTVPEDLDTRTFILGKLAIMIQELEKQGESAAVEEIPPRPLPNGSRYLNPEEVNWLLKYDPKVKSAAEKGAKGFRRQYPDKCSYMSDDMIIESILNMLYKLNRRDPEIISQLSAPPGPSFFKQYEEGTPEEIVIRYFESYSGREENYKKPNTTYSGSKTTTSMYPSTSSRKADAEYQREKSKKTGIIIIGAVVVLLAVIVFNFVIMPALSGGFMGGSKTVDGVNYRIENGYIVLSEKVDKNDIPADFEVPGQIAGKPVKEIKDALKYTDIETLTIGDGVEIIGDNAFTSCDDLKTVSLPASITKIGTDAFFSCDSVETFTFRGTVKQWESIDIADGAFAWSSIRTVTCSDGTVTLN